VDPQRAHVAVGVAEGVVHLAADEEHGNGQLCLSGQLPAYLRRGRLASTVSVGRTALCAASGLVGAATVEVKSRGEGAPNSWPLTMSSLWR
jgi:hypothetical protein